VPLVAIRSALPSVKETAAEIAAQTGADEAFVREKIGIATRYILGPDETGLDLANAACTVLFAETNLSPDAVDLVVYVTQNPDRRLPHNAPKLCDMAGIGQGCASFDLSLGCSGYVYGLSVVESFMAFAGFKNAVLVTCDPYSRIMAAEDKVTNAVFGDAATASWVRTHGPGGRLHALDFGTDGSQGDAIRINAGGAAMPLVSLAQTTGVAQTYRDDLRLHMEGRSVFNFVNSKIPGSLTASLEAAGLTLDDIAHFALHQGSAYMLLALARRVGIPEEKLAMNIAKYGNTVSSTIPLLLQELMKSGALAGRHVMISGFGVGLSWASGILTFDNDFPREDLRNDR
jgi:3-oxoacyl-[acyl-carrier-protein] synthase-3